MDSLAQWMVNNGWLSLLHIVCWVAKKSDILSGRVLVFFVFWSKSINIGFDVGNDLQTE